VFFEKHGPITIFLARFVPIVRTFAPLVAGAAKMRYSTFLVYNVIGAIVWGAGVTLLGFWLGQISFIQDNIDYIFLLIVFVSVLPIISELYKRWRRRDSEDAIADPIHEAPTEASDTAS
jgi:membrane-associated protein